MNAKSPTPPQTWSRPRLDRTGPDRRPGTYYRAAGPKGSAVGGIPLSSTEDAVTAAVRMAYHVAEAQIDRSSRLAARLRSAGDRAVGKNSDRHAVDAAEQLVFKAMLGGLTWVESLTAEGDSPLKRLAVAQYRIIGGMLGLGDGERHERPGASASASGDRARTTEARAEAPVPPGSLWPARIQIVHTAEAKERRAIQILRCEITRATLPLTPLAFYSTEAARNDTFDASFRIDENGPTLTLATAGPPIGLWRAAICDGDVQVGWIEIEV